MGAIDPLRTTRTCLRIAAASLILSVIALTQVTIPVATAEPDDSAAAAAELNALYSSQGVAFRGPENCDGDEADHEDGGDPWANPAAIAFCSVKDVVGALGGPSSGAPLTDFVEMPNRFEFDQPTDCDKTGAVEDGTHDDCDVVTGALTLLRQGLPVRLFGVCAKPLAKDCAVLGTITDPEWTTDGVYMLMNPNQVTVQCQYAQDASRNGCNADGAYTAGQPRPSCQADPADPMCEYGPDQQAEMLAAYANYCTKDSTNCLENQLEAQWGVQSIVAVGYINRIDQPNDCVSAATKAAIFTDAVNTRWSAHIPTVQINIDVAQNRVAFVDAEPVCGIPTF